MNRKLVKRLIVTVVILVGLSIAIAWFAINRSFPCAAPCISTDIDGHALIVAVDGPIKGVNGIYVDVTDEGTLITFHGGIEFSEMTTIETAEWGQIMYKRNGDIIVACLGSDTLSREQIERFRQWDGSVYQYAETDLGRICDEGEILLGTQD